MPNKQKPHSKLSPYAYQLAKTLFEHYPQWSVYVVTPEDEHSRDELLVRIPSRFEPNCPLRIWTMDDEVTVAWGFWHIDFYGRSPELSAFHQRIVAVLDLIADLLNERIAVYDIWSGDKVSAAGTCPVDKLDEYLAHPTLLHAEDRITTRSWAGMYNRGEFDPAKL